MVQYSTVRSINLQYTIRISTSRAYRQQSTCLRLFIRAVALYSLFTTSVCTVVFERVIALRVPTFTAYNLLLYNVYCKMRVSIYYYNKSVNARVTCIDDLLLCVRLLRLAFASRHLRRFNFV